MRSRCTYTYVANYVRYGGRGIRVCERWQDFRNFLADVGECPVGMTLERLDNNRGYEPGNVRWATVAEQSANQRNNVRITFEGRTLHLAAWARELGLDYGALYWRIVTAKWPLGRALRRKAS